MKKIFLVTVLCIVILLVAIYLCKDINRILPFQLESYSQYIEKYPSDAVVGKTDSAEDAEKNAKLVWQQIFGEAAIDDLNYTVCYDEVNRVWLIYGHRTLFSFRHGVVLQIGGVPFIIINQEDGKVLAVWHTK